MSETAWLILLQGLSSAAIIATFFVFWWQLGAMRGMLAVSRETSRHENLVTLINLLQAQALIDARLATIKLGRAGKAHEEWTEEEQASVEQVCNSFNLAAILIRHEVVPERPLLDQWGDSIVKCYGAAERFIAHVRQVRGDDHWAAFEWLAERARNRGGTGYSTDADADVTTAGRSPG